MKGLAYAAMLLGTAALFLGVREIGAARFEPVPAAVSATAPAEPAPVHSSAFLKVLIALAVVAIAGRALGSLCTAWRQPAVIGEIVAGILLGPSLLGKLAPETMSFLFPTSILPMIEAIANLGLVLFMFTIGLQLDTSHLSERKHASVAISHAGIVLPFSLGLILALVIYPHVSSREVPFTGFALFVGVALSVTAFPVLARILTDRGLSQTRLGIVALACAAADDVSAWCLLAIIVGVARADLSNTALVLTLTAAYLGFMLFVARPLVARYLRDRLEAEPSPGLVALFLTGVLLSAAVTEAIGIHAVFGAFLFGAVIPSSTRVARRLVEMLQQSVAVLLLPAFFAFTGLRTEIGLVSGLQAWLICGAIIVVATVGKFGGTLVAARVCGVPWRESAALGVLMNTRGLMELIVLNIGLDLKILSPTLFAMMVLMALVTTIATGPLLQRLWPHPEGVPEPAAALEPAMT